MRRWKQRKSRPKDYFTLLLTHDTFKKRKFYFVLFSSSFFSSSFMKSSFFFFPPHKVFITHSLTYPDAHMHKLQSSLERENRASSAKVQRRSFAKMISRSVFGVFRFLYSIQPRFMSLLCLLNLLETWAQFCLCWQF